MRYSAILYLLYLSPAPRWAVGMFAGYALVVVIGEIGERVKKFIQRVDP